MWAEQACSSQNNMTRVDGLSAASDGTFYTDGDFAGTMVLGGGTSEQITIAAQPISDTVLGTSFVARFAADGHPMWAHILTNLSPSDATAMASGGVVVTERADNLQFSFDTPAFNPPAFTRALLARYDANGVLQWEAFISSSAAGADVTIDAAAAALAAGGGVTIAGTVQQVTATFSAGTPQVAVVNPTPTGNDAGFFDPYIAHYAEDGTLVWVRRQGGPAQEKAVDLAATADGGVVLTGLFGVLASPGRGVEPPTTAIFGPGEPNETTLTQVGQINTYLARFDGSGQLVWAKREGGANVQPATNVGLVESGALAAYPDGGSIVVGQASGEIVFAEGEAGQRAFDLGPTETAMFVARLAP
jgi:hypothetical protein